MDWYNLAADNGLEMYSVLDVGQVLRLPQPGERPHAAMPLQSTAVVAPARTVAASAPAVSVQHVTVAPATSVVSTSGESSFEQCVISRESGGNPNVFNGSGHYGLFQFSEQTWVAYGGSPGDFGNASASEQDQVFDNAMAAGGESNWAPYDGC